MVCGFSKHRHSRMEKAEAKLDSIIIFPNFVDFFFFISSPIRFFNSFMTLSAGCRGHGDKGTGVNLRLAAAGEDASLLRSYPCLC